MKSFFNDDLTFKEFGDLTVISYYGKSSSRKTLWLCKCLCGKESVVQASNLKSGTSKSCGKCCKNTFYKHVDGYMVGITSKGTEFYFDKEDFELISSYNWNNHSSGYICKGNATLLHRFLLGITDRKVQVDHRNTMRTDCRRENLRLVTNQQNSFNSSKTSSKTSSKYKGVYHYASRNKWTATIQHSKKQIRLGYFDSEIEAAKAYDKKAKELYGEFAKLNFEEGIA